MRPALGAAFIVGTLAFITAIVHVALTDAMHVTDVAGMVGACLTVGATVKPAIRRQPDIDELGTIADIYERELKQVSADR